ncbi:hypothetical protein H6B07_04070 [Mediterraneibacter glycyrrhizinilyticus]|nr:hypothetical protein [Mediterraneibacter glycyrrhizinilyticus]MBM6801855.1 hypothetical protein [Mediterraneibacter glycyrrhizinilyticus]
MKRKKKRKPGWAKKTAEGRRLFRWLGRRKEQTFTRRGWQFIKVYHCPFVFVYGQTAEKERYVCRDLQFLAIFNMDTWELTDVSYQLRSFLGIPENQKFRFQQKCKRQAEQEIQNYAIKLLGEEQGWKEKGTVPWKKASVLCRYKDWIRKEAGIQAAGGEASGRLKEGIRPFTFDGERDSFDYRTYLSYLKNPETFIFRYGRKFCKRIKEQYRINQILTEAVEQERIRYQKERRERIALIMHIREAVKGIDDEVAVITEAGNDTYDVFHMEPEILRSFLGIYPISAICGKEKRKLLKKYGKDKAWDITEIRKVGCRGRWLYEAEKPEISDAA